MRTQLTVFALVLLLASLSGIAPAQAQRIASTQIDAPDEAPLHDLRVDVAYLSSDVLEGRQTGSPGAEMAARYIAERFGERGLTPAVDGSWYQPFGFRYSPNPHVPAGEGEQRTGRNVVGLLDNGADRTVVIGAHYDHLGYGDPGSRQPGDSLIHNGADDNASGVAALFEIARQLQTSDAHASNVLFVAFSGEELGLYGSKHFVQHAPVPLERMRYMINLDMVGRLSDERRLVVSGAGTSPAWTAALDTAAAATALALARDASGIGASDHTSFYLEDLPAVHLFTGVHGDYHTPADDSHRIDYAGLQNVATFATRLVEALDDDGALAFTETNDEQPERRMAFNVTLGIMPDYVFDGKGLRIDAVTGNDGPAARAGLQEGDVLIQLGDTEIADIYTYMEALGNFEEGDTARVVVQRGGERLEKDVQF